MNTELKQLYLLLSEYNRLYKEVADKYSDIEYLAWISMLDSTQWPRDGEFAKARKDPEFRRFREVYRKASLAIENFQWGLMPSQTRKEYQARFVTEYGGVPF